MNEMDETISPLESPVKQVNSLRRLAAVRLPTPGEMRLNADKLNALYAMAETAILENDVLKLEHARSEIDKWYLHLQGQYLLCIESCTEEEGRAGYAQELKSLDHCQEEFASRVAELPTTSVHGSLPELIPSPSRIAPSIVSSHRTSRSSRSRSSRASTTASVRSRKEAKIAQELAVLRVKQMDEDNERDRRMEKAEEEQRIAEAEAEEVKRIAEAKRRKAVGEKNKVQRELERQKQSRDMRYELESANARARILDQDEPERENASPILCSVSRQDSPVAAPTKRRELVFQPVSARPPADRNYTLPPSGRREDADIIRVDSTLSPQTELGIDNENPAVLPCIVKAVGETMGMPRPDHLTFSGDPTDYYTFIRYFESNLECKARSYGMRMTLLVNQCKGKAKAMIEHCSVLEPHEGYPEARKILYDNFGKPHIVSRAFVDRLIKGPNLKIDDAVGMRSYAQAMRSCLLVLSKLGNFADLNTVDRLVALANKLPYESQRLWRRRVAQIVRTDGREADFQDIVKFVEEESTVVNTLPGQLCVFRKSEEKKKEVPKTNRRGGVTCAAVHTEPSTSTAHTVKCPFCDGGHILADCRSFQKKSVANKKEFLWHKKMCFNCFGYRHGARYCREANACTARGCSLAHHTLLHEDVSTHPRPPEGGNGKAPRFDNRSRQTSRNFTANCNVVKNCHSSYFYVLPVKIRSKSGHEVVTYAFLDQGSDISFYDKRLIDMLDLEGKPRQVTMSSVGRRPTKHTGDSSSFTVVSLNGEEEIEVVNALSIDKIPVEPNPTVTKSELTDFPHLQGLDFPALQGQEVLLLIGTDVPYAHRVIEMRTGDRKQPFAARTPLGWSLVGPSVCYPAVDNVSVNFLQCATASNAAEEWQEEFRKEGDDLPFPTSVEDRKVLKSMNDTIEHSDGHFYLPLPWRDEVSIPEGSRRMAERRLWSLEKRLKRDDGLKDKYVSQMQDYIDKGYAEEVPEKGADDDRGGVVWYLPHHPVTHPRKPDKVRIVFDCAAQHRGLSLNDALLQGPDLVNSLIGVLERFRLNKIAIVADVEAMFHQVRVRKNDIDALRFLWWPGGDLSQQPRVHRMLVHIFGATSSPSCATFCLKATADKFGDTFDKDVTDIIRNDFYVDDCLTSTDTVERAVEMIAQLRDLLKLGGFRLTKWMSNDQRVLDHIPDEEKAKALKNVSLDGSVKECVLGVHWRVHSDDFGFNITDTMKGKKLTRRNILSAVNTLYDPLGFAAPVTLVAKILQQEIIRQKLDWDDELLEQDAAEWRSWLAQLPELERLTLPRCFKPTSFGTVAKWEMHHFSDASTQGYGTVSYLRLEDIDGTIHCSFLFGKSKVTPPKTESIPRLELAAAVLAVKADKWLKFQLKLENCESVFWTDSCAVRQSIYNQSKRFRTFVANRLAKIHRQSEPRQWRHVNTRLNPADDASRGLSVRKLINSRWLIGPKFLWQTADHWPTAPEMKSQLPEEFQPMERKRITVNVCAQSDSTDRLLERFSTLHKLKVSVAWLLRYKSFLRSKNSTRTGKLRIQELKDAELEVIKYVQRQCFAPVINILSSDGGSERDWQRQLKKSKYSSYMAKFNPQLTCGILRIGGRLSKAPIAFDSKHPIILPYDHHITTLMIRRHHSEVGHSGTAHTWASLRQRFWIIKGGAAVRKELNKCVLCRKRSVRRGQQQMADLPSARLKPDEPPFTYVGIDYFGPFMVKRGRSEVKSYGCIFTCLTMRAVHIEIAPDLSTDAFINALRRFIGRRGRPKEIYSDNGTNFVGAERVLREALQGLRQSQLDTYFAKQEISWHFNCPAASHMGGIWERMIRSIRRILNAMLTKHHQSLSADMLQTLMIEVESILNSRPLMPISFESPGEEPLTPNHLLLGRASGSMPVGLINPKDCYSRRRWKQIQLLTDEFWRRWSREYLPTIALRQKWPDRRRNFETGDVVMIVDETQPRRRWEMGRVVQAFPDSQGVVRQVEVKTQSGAMYKRPIAKLCLLCEASTKRE